MRRLRLELFEAVHDQNLCLHGARGRTWPGCADAVAKPEHDDRLSSRLDNLCALVAAYPFGDHHALGVHVLEAVPVHFGDRPLNRPIERRRPAETVPDRVGQHRQAIPGERASERFADQARGGLTVCVEPVDPARRHVMWRLSPDIGNAQHQKR